MSTPKDSDTEPKLFKLSWRSILIHLTLLFVCVVLGLFSWYLSRPQSIRFYQTNLNEYLTVPITSEIDISLDHNSSFAVTDYAPLRIEMLKGNAYFNIKKKQADDFRIKVGEVFIEDFGTRFSIRMQKHGAHIVSVGQGKIKLHTASDEYLISALEQADFDNSKISKHRMISINEVAPWYKEQLP